MEEELKTIPTEEELEVINPDGVEIDMSLVEQFIEDDVEDDIQDNFNEDSLEILCESGEIENGEI